MKNNAEIIIFDDWAVRDQKQYKSIYKTYKFVLYMFLIINIFLFVLQLITLCFYEWEVSLAVFVMLMIFSICDVFVYFGWLEIKHNHLIIKPYSIEITDKFNRTQVYFVNYKECELILYKDYHLTRRGGQILTFVDNNGRKVCRYIDVINTESILGNSLTEWEKALVSLGIPVVDKAYVFKNNLWGK